MKKYHQYAGTIAIVIIWGLVTSFRLVNPFFLPGPIEVLSECIRMFSEAGIIWDILITLKRIIISFILVIVIGLPLGLVLGRFEKLYRSMEFTIDFIRSLAPLCLFPLFMIIFGIGDISKIAVAVFSTSSVLIFNVAYGVMHAKKSRVLAAQIMGANRFKIFTTVIFWESLPQIFVGIRNSLAWAALIILAAEMFVGTNAGLGHKIIDYQITYNIPGVYASIILTGILGYCLNAILAYTEKRVVHWIGR